MITAAPVPMTHGPGANLFISRMKPSASRNMPPDRKIGYRLGCGT
jgi:hypothetical protein